MNNQATTTKKGYTWVQYFFWLFTGAEISLLKDCPTDYNRQAGIGFTIFMTTVFAMFAGGYAGYYFTLTETSPGSNQFEGSYVSAIVFGLIWGLLIFSIDRSLVVSLKKKPKSADYRSGWDKFWSFIGLFGGQFLTRAIVGGLIAFVISIPLEILIFKENISIQMEKDKVNDIDEQRRRASTAMGVGSIKIDITKLDTEISKAENAAKDCKNAIGYSEKDNEYRKELAKIPPIEKELVNAKRIRDFDFNQIPFDEDGNRVSEGNARKKYLNSNFIYNNKIKLLNRQQSIVNGLLSKRNEICENFRADQLLIATNKIKEKNKKDTLLTERQNEVDSTTNVTEELLRTQKGFTRQFAALGNAANAKDGKDVLLLLWLIRAIFFLIEILPTVVKLATPFGAYDALVYNKEKNFEEILLPKIRQDLERGIDLSSAQDNEVTLAINENEKALRLKMVEEISRVQLEIANQYLAEYEKVARSQAPRQVQEFINRQS